MADKNYDIDESSRLLESSDDFRTCSIAKNSKLYTYGDEYCEGSSYTIADGDDRGRDPIDGNPDNPSIGIPIDVKMRECLLAKNSYTKTDSYCPSTCWTIADGDNRGRNPEDGDQNNPEIGIPVDICCRTFLTARNLYNRNNEYCAGSDNV